MPTPPAPDIWATIAELDGGSVESQFRHAAVAVAKAMRDIDDSKVKGRLSLDMTFDRSKGSGQILVTTRVSVTRPTEKGKTSDESGAETLVYIYANGHMSVLPETQTSFDFEGSKP
ncbi:hypothetical protein [Thiocystis violacea]|uniref:hypothetical protein n=1 Tax=Thiocystis violacea TaxID=13725 RepID=UPI0019062014|nr:hypothetical protein [Thiocystis violacea]MBK1719190.1 hypothetical protein [Thiocystis violacea]